jgi:hypothetical protein
MLFKRFLSPRVRPNDSPLDPARSLPHRLPVIPADAPDAAEESDPRRSLASLMSEEAPGPKRVPAAERYRDVGRILAEEGGARVTSPASAAPPPFSLSSEGRGQRPADIEVRFSRCESTKDGLHFELHAPRARSVQLAGDFTEWRAEPMAPESGSTGRWRCTKPLPRGEYRYKFIVDGQWINDPLNPLRKPNPFGGTDSIVRVSIGP